MATTLTQSQTKDESQTEDGTQAHTPAALPPLPHKPVRIPTAQLSSQPIVNRRCLQQQRAQPSILLSPGEHGAAFAALGHLWSTVAAGDSTCSLAFTIASLAAALSDARKTT